MINFLRKIKRGIRIFNHRNDFNRLNKISNNDRIFLHFGCGPRVLKNWINIDLFFEPYKKYLKSYGEEHYPKDIRGTKKDFYVVDIIKSGLPLPNNSVDLIFHEDFIEHLNQKNQFIFLAETFRVLKSGGIHRINTPDLLKSMERSFFAKGKDGVFVEEWDKHGHINLLTKSYIEEVSKLIGYSTIIFNSKNNSISKDVPVEYRPNISDRSEDGNIFADLIK